MNTDLNILLKDILSDMQTTVSEKKATIILESLPPLIVNPGLMRPLFSNLVGNALKYSKKDVEPVIKIYSEISNAAGSENGQTAGQSKYCRIYVEDNGIGFDQKYAEQIFDMFTRLHLSGEFEGTGIGLALCKRIADLHNGFISARSKLSSGSTFIVSLPYAQAVVV